MIKINRLGVTLLVRGMLLCLIAGSSFFAMRGIGESLTPWSQATVSMLTNLFYSTQGRDQVTVLLFREMDLANLGEEINPLTKERKKLPFPLPYKTHIEILDSLLVREPKAVMIDFSFVDARAGDSVEELQGKLCEMHDAGIKVYLATFNYWADQFHGLRPDLFADHGKRRGESCFKVVPVNYKSGSNGLAQTYDLIQAGPKGDERPAGALQVYLDEHQLSDTAPYKEKMDILWGSLPPEPGFSDSVCSPVSLWETVKRLFLDGPGALKRDCAYSNTLSAWSLLRESSDQVQNLVEGKFVFYGAAFQGTDDWLQSPVHGNLPGVYLHAMALDNLISLKGRYKELGDHVLSWPPSKALLFDFLIILVGVCWQLRLIHYRNKLSIFLMPGDVLNVRLGEKELRHVLSRIDLKSLIIKTGMLSASNDLQPTVHVVGARRRTPPKMQLNNQGEWEIHLLSKTDTDGALKTSLLRWSTAPVVLLLLILAYSFSKLDNMTGMAVVLVLAGVFLANLFPLSTSFTLREGVLNFMSWLSNMVIERSWLFLLAVMCLALFYFGDMGPRNFWAFAAFLSFMHFVDGKLGEFCRWLKGRPSQKYFRSLVWLYSEDVYRLDLWRRN